MGSWFKENLKFIFAILIMLWLLSIKYENCKYKRIINSERSKLQKEIERTVKNANIIDKKYKKALEASRMAQVSSRAKINDLVLEVDSLSTRMANMASRRIKKDKFQAASKVALQAEILELNKMIDLYINKDEKKTQIIKEQEKIISSIGEELEICHEKKLHLQKTIQMWDKYAKIKNIKSKKWFSVNLGGIANINGDLGFGICVGLNLINF